MKIATDVTEGIDLPNQFVIRNGRIVVAETGEPPFFPEFACNGFRLEGTTVSVVPRNNLIKLLNANERRRAKLDQIAQLIEES